MSTYTKFSAVAPYRGYPSPYHRSHGGSAGYPNGIAVASDAPAIVTGTADITAAGLYGIGGLLDGETLILTVNGVNHTLILNGATNVATEAAFLAAIMVQWPNLSARQAGALNNKLQLRTLGRPQALPKSIIVGAGSANAHLGLTAATTTALAGTAKPAIVGGRPVLSLSFPP